MNTSIATAEIRNVHFRYTVGDLATLSANIPPIGPPTQIGLSFTVYTIVQTTGLFLSLYIADRYSKKILLPFYRTDEARDRESGGTGLGLAIVETAIQQHRGWVKAEDSPLGGLRLVIWLPLYKRA